MKNRQTGFSQELSALKAGISIRSGWRIEKGDGDIDAGVLCYTLDSLTQRIADSIVLKFTTI